MCFLTTIVQRKQIEDVLLLLDILIYYRMCSLTVEVRWKQAEDAFSARILTLEKQLHESQVTARNTHKQT